MKSDIGNITSNPKTGGHEFAGYLFDALEGLANWIGMGPDLKRIILKIRNATAEGELPSDSELSILVNKIITDAQTKNSLKLEELQNKLVELQAKFPASQVVKQALNKAIQKAKDALKTARIKTAQADLKAQAAQLKSTEAANASTGDVVSGKAYDAYQQATKLANEAADAYGSTTEPSLTDEVDRKVTSN